MNLAALTNELTADPLERGYSGMTDVAAAWDLNTAYCERNRTMMVSCKVIQAINIEEWNALTEADQRKIWDVLYLGEIDPFGIEAQIFQSVFGASVTITTLQGMRVEAITRATMLGLGFVFPGHVENARY